MSDRDGEGCLQKLSDDGHSFSKKHDIAQGKPVNNLTLDIWEQLVHNEVTFMIFTDLNGMETRLCEGLLERTLLQTADQRGHAPSADIIGNKRRKKRWTYHLRLISADRWPW